MIFAMPAFRHWLYNEARRGTGERYRKIAKPGRKLIVIGDAAKPGTSEAAIASAFTAALLP